MAELASDFSSLPPEYKDVLRLAQDMHNIQVTPLQELKGGRSGAYLYLVSVSSPESKPVQHLILKLDHKGKKTKMDELERHGTAVREAPADFTQNHIANLAFDRAELEGAVAIFYTIAGQSLHRCQSLASLQQQSKLEEIFRMTNEVLLTQWNAALTFEQAVHPQKLLTRWLGYRLLPGGNIGLFMEDDCRIPQNTAGLMIQGIAFPNPLAYARDSGLWGATRPIDTMVGFQHGDLNIGNILVTLGESDPSFTGYYLIDFALFKNQMPLLYDQRYLEMSYLVRELSRIAFPKWVDLVARFAERDIVDPDQVPVELSGACAVVAAGRSAFRNWVEAFYPSLSDDLWGQFWLAGVAAGLNFCNKAAIAQEERLAGLIFAAAHLKRYHVMFGVRLPVEVKHLSIVNRPGGSPPSGMGRRVPTASNRQNLPVQPTPFIGRHEEVKAGRDLLTREKVRLITMTGPGGTGKTRLALEVAALLIDHFEDGVYFVDLAPIREPELVPATIARTVGLREKSDRPLLDELKGQLQARKMLLILDNFEQVMPAAPQVGELLRDCTQLKLLVTSREALRVRGENVFAVPPLALPGTDSKKQSIEQLTQCGAIQLFVERSQALKPDFELTNENAQAVAEICLQLDGLPLAIELATARIVLFSPQALLKRLNSRLKLLRAGAHDLPERQQTLRNTIDWSYELLGTGEKRLFSLLSVFASCTLEAVETVAGGMKQLDETGVDILEGIASMVDKNLIRRVDQGTGEPRFRMLETIREYAAERLNEGPEFSAAARRAHGMYFADLSRRQWERMASHGREAALGEIESDLENVASAWRYWVAEGDLEQLNNLTDSLWQLYDARGWFHASVGLTADLLNVLASSPSTPERAQQEIMLRVSLARALMAIKGYTTPEVEKAYARALELCQRQGEIPQLFSVLRGLSSYYAYNADFEKGARMGEQILSLAESQDDASIRVEGHLVLGYNLAFFSGLRAGLNQLEKAIANYDPDRRRTHRFRFGYDAGVPCFTTSALILWMLGFPDRALKRGNDAVTLANRLNHPFTKAYALFHTGLLHLWRREMEPVQERAQALLEVADKHEFQIWRAVSRCLHGAALAGMGRAGEGLSMMNRGIDLYKELRTPPVFWPILLVIRAGMFGQAGRPAEGLPLLDEALQILGQGPGNPLLSEPYRLKGELLLALSPQNLAEVEFYLQRSLEIAQAQQATMFELRAATSLSRLWRIQGKTEHGRQVLSDAYEKLTEGFTTADVNEARELLAELS